MEANRLVVDEAIRQRVRECLDTSIKLARSGNTHSAAQLEATIYSKAHTLEQYKSLAKVSSYMLLLSTKIYLDAFKNFIEHVRKKASGVASARAAASAMPPSNTLPAGTTVIAEVIAQPLLA
jgi:nitrogen fixation/metabolism regulation signal transduction histidine kinase